jgi:hypothetical protein
VLFDREALQVPGHLSEDVVSPLRDKGMGGALVRDHDTRRQHRHASRAHLIGGDEVEDGTALAGQLGGGSHGLGG